MTLDMKRNWVDCGFSQSSCIKAFFWFDEPNLNRFRDHTETGTRLGWRKRPRCVSLMFQCHLCSQYLNPAKVAFQPFFLFFWLWFLHFSLFVKQWTFNNTPTTLTLAKEKWKLLMENIDVFTSQGHKHGPLTKKFCILRSRDNPVLTIRRLVKRTVVALFDKAQWKTTSCFFYSLLFAHCLWGGCQWAVRSARGLYMLTSNE